MFSCWEDFEGGRRENHTESRRESHKKSERITESDSYVFSDLEPSLEVNFFRFDTIQWIYCLKSVFGLRFSQGSVNSQ